jgi:hypothetical protein
MATHAAAGVMQFGLIDAGSTNLGDEIQAIAARHFLPRIDRYLPREALDREPDGASPVMTVMNGWYMANPQAWPPHPKITPLLVSVHLTQHRASRKRFWIAPASKRMLTPAGVEWLKAHGPVGARDHATRRVLEAHGIESHYSGCLTLTLPARPNAQMHGRVVACDLPPAVVEELARRTNRPPLIVTHIDATRGFAARLDRAEALLDLYAGSRAVVTSRLHCALPCLALGTPVLFVPTRRDRYRLQPALDLTISTSQREFLKGGGFDPEMPPPNPGGFAALAEALRRRVRDFVALAERAQGPEE